MNDTAVERPPPTRVEWASWILAGLAMVAVLLLHLLPAMIGGLLIHELVLTLAPRVRLFRVSRSNARLVAVGLLAAVAITAITGAILAIVAYFQSESGSMQGILQSTAEILESSRAVLPAWAQERLPASDGDVRGALAAALREHADTLQSLGKGLGRGITQLLIGMILGALIALREVSVDRVPGPLAMALFERAARLGLAFRRIVFAQVRISALNTVLTGLYLAVVLPLFGIDLPLVKTLVAVTFLAGLIPVLGNLISNTVITVVSMSVSLEAAMASLAYLIGIHKLEYFVNARIVGTQITASSWEILVAMLVMEAAFGLPGVVAAPIVYAWVKDELSSRGLI